MHLLHDVEASLVHCGCEGLAGGEYALIDVIDSDLGENSDDLVDHDNVGVSEPRVVLLVFIVPITELGSGDGVGKVHEELDYERTVRGVIVTLDAEPEHAGKVCHEGDGV